MFLRQSFRRVAVACTAASALLLAGCTGGGATANQSAEAPILQVYRGASGQFVENYNPLSPTVLKDVDGLIYERMFFFDNTAPLDADPLPELGTAYTVSDDGTSVTVTLQDGVEWSDGEPFTADDVAFTFNTIRKNKALDKTGNPPAAKVTGDNEVTLTFDAPSFATVPTVLAQPVVPEHIFSKMDDIATDPNRDPVGTGPMALKDFSASSYLFEKSESFRDADQVAVPGVRYFSLSGNDAATNKLLAGELDWAGIAIPDVEKVLKPHPDVNFQDTTNQQIVLATCSNVDLGCKGPQTDPAVRHAMAAAIDRNQINELAYYGRGVPISPTFGVPGRDDALIDPEFEPLPMTADVDKATSLLEDAGWKRGGDGIYAKDGQRLSLTVIVTSGYTDYISALDVMTEQLKKAGIEIKPEQRANAEVNNAVGLGKFEVAISAFFDGAVADPGYIYSNSFNSANTSAVGESNNPYGNILRYSNPDVDAAIKAADGTDDPAEKAAQYANIQKEIVADMPAVPVLNNKGFGVFSNTYYTGWKLYNGGVNHTLLGLEAK